MSLESSIIILSVFVFLENLLDALLTSAALSAGAVELNPVILFFMGFGWHYWIMAKVIYGALFVAIMAIVAIKGTFSEKALAFILLFVVSFLYLMVLVYHRVI